ncbi:2'-5' RNA ligase family protein [Streptomyces acidiscabies]|uniref:2'-5' RNA ligase family protein n=1 Tax=Streptomyces acidiscabies TaxID=42234 RepID=A0ABU4MAG1_9ACTN|nr:2'-5' RNA ligase family protein [Streptomyces acidiscabies]MDX3024985.1 2'-5' RNA ligase family protein [Streptomyces acidiscabies]
MDNFFARVTSREHAWPAGRRDLHWHLLPSPDEAAALTEPYREVTRTPGLNPVAAEWLHVTVLHAGPQSDSSDAEVAAMVDQVSAAAAEVDPFALTLYPPAVGTVALECAGRPGAPARRLWELTAAATREVMGEERFALIPAVYYPHASVAYAGPEAHLADRTALKVALSDVEAGPVTVQAHTLSLVAQWHDGRSQIVWEHLASVPLGGAGTRREGTVR